MDFERGGGITKSGWIDWRRDPKPREEEEEEKDQSVCVHLNPNCRSPRLDVMVYGKSAINLSRLSVDSIRNERHKFIKAVSDMARWSERNQRKERPKREPTQIAIVELPDYWNYDTNSLNLSLFLSPFLPYKYHTSKA